MNVVAKNQLYFLCLLLLCLVFNGCKKDAVPVKINRFDQDLFAMNKSNAPGQLSLMAKRYGFFFTSFAENMLTISPTEARVNYEPSLLRFISHPSIRQLKHEVDSVFPDLNALEAELGDAVFYYSRYFPKEPRPVFLSYISEFYAANFISDSMVGIGLDMYLGDQYKLYHGLEFPGFMIAKLRREYIVPNALKSLGIGRYEHQLKDKRFLAMMLFEGKLKYFTRQLMPGISDTILFGYTAQQMQWCKQNESMIWAHIIGQKWLYNIESGQYMRYFNDGPFTIANGVPQDSAPAIAVYEGYQVIASYMKENKHITLSQLMDNQDWDGLLKASRYKP